jgi:hypothetical protein
MATIKILFALIIACASALAQRRIVVEVANELPSEDPHVIDVFLDGLRR